MTNGNSEALLLSGIAAKFIMMTLMQGTDDLPAQEPDVFSHFASLFTEFGEPPVNVAFLCHDPQDTALLVDKLLEPSLG